MNVYIVVRSVWADWSDHPYWDPEDGDMTADRGYWTTREGAEAYVEAAMRRRLDAERDTWRKTVAAEQAKSVHVNNERVKRQHEWDVIDAAGLTPTFKRPETQPTVQSWDFDEEKVRKELLKAEKLEVEELEPHA